LNLEKTRPKIKGEIEIVHVHNRTQDSSDYVSSEPPINIIAPISSVGEEEDTLTITYKLDGTR